MGEVFPSVIYKQKNDDLQIEVMTFEEVSSKVKSPKGHDPYAPHKIAFYLIMVVTEGEMKHFVDFKFYTLHKGSVLFVAKNQLHHFTDSFKTAKGYCIILNSAFLEDHYFIPDNIKFNRLYNYHLEEPILHQHEMGEDSFMGVVQKLYEEYHFPDSYAKREILRALVHIILLKSERVKESRSKSSAQPYWFEVFTTFKNKLEKEYVQTRSSAYYASQLNVSYKFLNDVVKKLTQKTIKAFIDDFVTTEIKRYLVSSSLSVKEIGYKTGFEEPSNLVKFFKKNTDITPLLFRKDSE
ncbi:helix-turn-helix domain-containing protein [Labilibacter marinus]|uniref:helix-turn-helix domain-containing protein n=1 Tax=Labilibacter marinus TaxID=1477105 RepID=UPI00082A0621|nr:helix-turn-helix domain-containing protein [Labilibacter marinus]